MKFALFLGCTIPARLKPYEASARAVLEKLGVGLVDIDPFNCCGYPLRNIEFKAFLLSSARNLALAEGKNLNVLALCQCCYGSLKKADYLLRENPSLRQEVNGILKEEDLQYEGKIEVKHLLTVLHKEVGLESIKAGMKRIFKAPRIAVHYGCHALRPSRVVQFDNPLAPSLFDQLVEATGAKSIDWQTKLDCCGAPLWGIHDELSMDLTAKKLMDGKQSGADYLCTACPYCHLQFDRVQKMMVTERGLNPTLPPILYTQLLGLAMGIDRETLGLQMNQIPADGIQDWLSER